MRIAECFVKMGDTAKASKTLQTLLREYPHYNPARLKLGIIYYNNQNLAEATQQWENILLRDPRHAEALKYLKMAQTVGITTLSP
jgi:tetratricopeptide (TPR) repeat protein